MTLCCVLSLGRALPSFGLNWGKQAQIFVLMEGLGRAGTGAGWVKFWEHQNLAMLGMQHLIPFLVPCGMWGELRGRMTAVEKESRGNLSCREPELSPQTVLLT